MKTLHEKAKAYFDGLKTVFIDVIGVEKSSQLQQLKVLELFTPNAFIAGYEAHRHETRWRSVEEELPEPNKKVLVKRNLDVFGGDPAEHQLCYLGKYDDGKIVWLQCETEQPACRITHWKPIE